MSNLKMEFTTQRPTCSTRQRARAGDTRATSHIRCSAEAQTNLDVVSDQKKDRCGGTCPQR